MMPLLGEPSPSTVFVRVAHSLHRRHCATAAESFSHESSKAAPLLEWICVFAHTIHPAAQNWQSFPPARHVPPFWLVLSRLCAVYRENAAQTANRRQRFLMTGHPFAYGGCKSGLKPANLFARSQVKKCAFSARA